MTTSSTKNLFQKFQQPATANISPIIEEGPSQWDIPDGHIGMDIREDLEAGGFNMENTYKNYQDLIDRETNSYREESVLEGSMSYVSLFSGNHKDRQRDSDPFTSTMNPMLKAQQKISERFKRAQNRGVAPPGKKLIHFNPLDPEYVLRSNAKNTNRVRLTRYTLLTWAPLSLFYQFKRVSNIYFLIITILTYMPFSPKSPQSMLGTFAAVLFFTMMKEAFEDYQRFKQQQSLNFQKITRAIRQPLNKKKDPIDQFEDIPWGKAKVGQIILIKKGEEIPADILLVQTAKQSNGVAYVDTRALDGETNLKEKQTILEVEDDEDNLAQLRWFSGTVLSDNPNDSLEHWEGHLTLSTSISDQNNKNDPSNFQLCTIKNLLLRGTVLRNTEWAAGIVINTGADTKIQMNSSKQLSATHKVSNVMKLMNRMLLTVFIFQLVIIFTCASFNYTWSQDNISKHPETGLTESDLQQILSSFFTQILAFWVAFSHMIPISLYVSIEVLKLGLATLINKDVAMYDKETQSLASCRNSDLIEELGQVEIIFSDKTGTLTMNQMIFKKCSIVGVKFGEPQKNEKINELGMCQSGIDHIKECLQEETEKYMQRPEDIYRYPILNFFKALSICHSVLIQTTDNQKREYQASSPDELALVQGANSVGIDFTSRDQQSLTITNLNSDEHITEQFTLLQDFPFDSTRKCMSVLAQDQLTKRIFLYCKGADNVMLQKIDFNKSVGLNGSELKSSIEKDLYNYSCEGYRTLVIGMRRVSEKEYKKFQKIFNKIHTTSSPETKDSDLSNLYSQLESKLRYLGSTAIEDKLQAAVPEAISNLVWAEVRFWMLTGDKLETAIEIAKSCKIIEQETLTVVLQPATSDALDLKSLRGLFKQKEREIRSHLSKKGSKIQNRSSSINHHGRKKLRIDPNASLKDYPQEDVVVVVEGSILGVILNNRELEDRFFQMTLTAKSVVCCRVSPKQKADVVSMYRNRGNWVTLSIGDGANDVPMILEANIGVGIKGKEGTQAVRSADYSLSQFQHLQRLLFFHGRSGYIRVSKMICSYFYKNIVLVFAELNFIFFTGFSGQLFFLEWLPMMYNAVFTSWQCLFAFMFERDVTPLQAQEQSQVYKIGQEGRMFNFKVFWREILLAFWHGAVCFYVPMFGCAGISGENGIIREHWFYSTISFALILHLVTYKLFVDSYFWNILSVSSSLIGMALFYAFALIASLQSIADMIQPQLTQLMPDILNDSKFYLLLFTSPILCLIPDFTLHYFDVLFYPHLEHFLLSGSINSHSDRVQRIKEARKRLDDIVYRNSKSFLLKQQKQEKRSYLLQIQQQQNFQHQSDNKSEKKVSDVKNVTDISGQQQKVLRSAIKAQQEQRVKKFNVSPQFQQIETQGSTVLSKYPEVDISPNVKRKLDMNEKDVKMDKKALEGAIFEEDYNKWEKQERFEPEFVSGEKIKQKVNIPTLNLSKPHYLSPTPSPLDDLLTTDREPPRLKPLRENDSDHWLTYRDHPSQRGSFVEDTPQKLSPEKTSPNPFIKTLRNPQSIEKAFESMLSPRAVDTPQEALVRQLTKQRDIGTYAFLKALASPERLKEKALGVQISNEELKDKGHPLEKVRKIGGSGDSTTSASGNDSDKKMNRKLKAKSRQTREQHATQRQPQHSNPIEYIDRTMIRD